MLALTALITEATVSVDLKEKLLPLILKEKSVPEMPLRLPIVEEVENRELVPGVTPSLLAEAPVMTSSWPVSASVPAVTTPLSSTVDFLMLTAKVSVLEEVPPSPVVVLTFAVT